MFRTVTRFAALLQPGAWSFFLIEDVEDMSLKDMAELSTTKWCWNTRITKNPAQ